MKRVEFLITDVRQSTDNTDTNAVSTQEIQTYFNDAQYQIQSLIFRTNPKSNIFTKVGFIDTSAGGNVFSLPSDIYAQNSIRYVEKLNSDSSINNDNYFKLNPLQPEERRTFTGYWIEDQSMYLTPNTQVPSTYDIRLTYFKKLPTISKRVGQIASFISGTSVTLAVGADSDLNTLDDWFCIVDSNGVIKVEGAVLSGYNNGSRVISTSTTIPGTVTTADYVVIGKYASSHILLPDVCEPLIKDYVRARLHNRNANSTELKNQSAFTSEQQETIVGIFSDNQREVLYPPITDSDYVRI
jgi:hypothetical protein